MTHNSGVTLPFTEPTADQIANMDWRHANYTHRPDGIHAQEEIDALGLGHRYGEDLYHGEEPLPDEMPTETPPKRIPRRLFAWQGVLITLGCLMAIVGLCGLSYSFGSKQAAEPYKWVDVLNDYQPDKVQASKLLYTLCKVQGDCKRPQALQALREATMLIEGATGFTGYAGQ